MRNLGVVEFTEFIAPDGLVYPFDTMDRFIMTEEGLGMPPIEYITQKGPYQHGSSLVDYRLGDRIIQLVMREDACSRDQYWLNRAALLDAIRPNRFIGAAFGPGVLRKRFPNGNVRDISVIIEQGPGFSARSLDRWDEFGYTETLRFVAHDPIFFDPNSLEVGFDLTADLDQLVFPIEFPIVFDSSRLNSAYSIVYTGTWFSFPSFEITGPQKHWTVLNVDTNEKIELNYDISAGEVVTISLAYGNKTVTSSTGANLIGTVTRDSDLATFHIAPHPEVSNGDNEIQISSFGNNLDSVTWMTYFNRYVGI